MFYLLPSSFPNSIVIIFLKNKWKSSWTTVSNIGFLFGHIESSVVADQMGELRHL